MKLLIVTQSVDSKQFVPLMFFTEWLRAFGKQCERVDVIAQRVGEYDLQENIHIHSLGKESGRLLPLQIMRAWWLMWSLRKNYDAVLIHMTPIWVVLGYPIWWFLRKRMYLWYEARGTRWHTHLAVWIVRKIFSASPGGLPITTKKNVITGHGIDIDFFTPTSSQVRCFDTSQVGNFDTSQVRRPALERDPHLLLTLGRITKAKQLDVIIRNFAKLPSEYRLINIGAMITEQDRQTKASLEELIHELGLQERVTFRTVSDEDLRELLQRGHILLHASNATSLDKAVLQAMSCGCLVVTASPVVKPHVPELCRAEPETIATVTNTLLQKSSGEQDELRHELRAMIEEEHSLPKLVTRLVGEMEEMEEEGDC